MPFLLISPAFPPGGEIPRQYTCDGSDISPPLAWSGVPSGTASLVIVIADPDAPRGAFHHWAVFAIPPGWTGLPAGFGAAQPPAGSGQTRNDFGRLGYGGPCPPAGAKAHHYHFELLAIRRPTLDLTPGATPLEVLEAAEPYTIARTELVGTYRR